MEPNRSSMILCMLQAYAIFSCVKTPSYVKEMFYVARQC
jgi:hypothetical protein